jgi:hypothetical protein
MLIPENEKPVQHPLNGLLGGCRKSGGQQRFGPRFSGIFNAPASCGSNRRNPDYPQW